MKYYLDTNMCIYFLKGKYTNLLNKIKKYHPDKIKIASTVQANDGILVTNNTHEFKIIKNLKIENWVK